MTPAGGSQGSAAIAAGVSEVLGPDRTAKGKDGIPVSTPRSPAEAAELLRAAAERGWRVLPAGSRLAPSPPVGAAANGGGSDGRLGVPDLVLSSLGMAGLVEHEPGDLSVRVRAGSTLATVQAAVSAAGQWLALDPPAGAAATAGGVTATGIGGPLSAGYGRPRDQILGLTVVDGAGRALSLGGRVVKNVAGFDLVRLVAGSRGALGLITEIVFRLYPLPEEDRTLVWCRSDPISGWQVGRAAATLPVPVAAAELLVGEWPSPVPSAAARVLIRLTGSAKEVREIVEKMSESVGTADHELEGGASRAVFEAVSRAEGVGDGFRVHALPARGAELLEAAREVPTVRLAMGLLGGSLRAATVAGAGGELGDEAADALRARPGPAPSEENGLVSTMPSPSRVDRLRADLVRGFDPSGILPGTWRDGWRRAAV